LIINFLKAMYFSFLMKKFTFIYPVYVLIIAVALSACSSSADEYRQNLMSEKAAPVDTLQTLTTIAFGSCNRQDEPQPMWKPILANEPDLWLWLGDNIYGDTDDMQAMKVMYAEQKTNPGYEDFFQQVPIIGTWDDHDYGTNDGGKGFPAKAASRDLMLDFLDVPREREIRQREGAYDAYTFGPEGQQVKIMLLDTRYFRDDLQESAEEGVRYQPNPEGDILGEAQWKWLEEELLNSEAQVNIIASSIQVIPEQHGYEKWANFPNSRERLLQLVANSGAEGVVFLSGDRHMGEISRLNIAGVPYPVYDITSSGLTHSYEEADEPNRHREGEIVGQKNFGIIQVDWNDPVEITYSIRGVSNQVHQTISVLYP
jgi:alkaline phosphatase D